MRLISKPVDKVLTFLLEHLPPQMHLVITTREDPDLPLARLRARGQLTELRVSDLRFTPAEAAEFLNQMMGLNLSEENITALETRTEGWIAGLQLAALSMQGHQDVTSFIQSFTGSHHFVLDYLLEEVLQQQSESIQTFLLCTSILDRLCGPLCDAVLGSSSASGQETLEYLERPTCSLSRWITSDVGTAITISLAICCASAWENPKNSLNSTCAPVNGMKRTETWARRFSTPSQPGILSGRRGWLKRPGRA